MAKARSSKTQSKKSASAAASKKSTKKAATKAGSRKATTRKTTKAATTKKAGSKKASTKKASTSKASTKKTTTGKAGTKKPATKKAVTKKTGAKKTGAKKTGVKKAAAKKSTTKKTGSTARKTNTRSTVPGSNHKASTAGKPKRIKTHLDRKQLAHFRELLLEKRTDLVGDLSGMEDSALRYDRSNLSTMPQHMADMGSDSYDQDLTLGLMESERELLAEIDEALERIDQGTFGVCVETGKPINKARLEVKPWAKYCIEAARTHENDRR